MAVLIETRLNALKLNESANPRKGCLGRLEGICADFKNPTRNGRLYTRKLWENVFNDPIFKESLESKTLLGELDHPEDRLEVLAGEACIVMTDYRIDEDEGVIYAGFDILDTPRGKILKTLLDYGCVMGVSSRGQGDITTTSSGETVDEDTYDFACFDVVTTPAVEKARQNVVESVTKTKTFVESIRTQIKEAETIGDLNAIKRVVESTQTPELNSLLESIQNKSDSIKEGKTITSETKKESTVQLESISNTNLENNTNTIESNLSAKTIREHKELLKCVNDMRKQLNAYKFRESRLLQIINSKNEQIEHLNGTQNALAHAKQINNVLKKENKALVANNEKSINRLNESIVSQDNKLSMLKNSVSNQKKSILELTQNLNRTEKESNLLNEKLRSANKEITSLNKSLTNKDVCISKMEESLSSYKKQVQKQSNTIQNLNDEVLELKEQLQSLQSEMTLEKQQSTQNSGQMELEINSYSTLVDQLHEKVQNLQEQLAESNTQKNQLTNKLHHINEQLHKYQQNYVNTKSKQLGVDANMVQKLVNVDTTVSQINKIVEDLQDTKDRYTKLPFSESSPKGVVIETSSMKQTDPEEERLRRFVESVANVHE